MKKDRFLSPEQLLALSVSDAIKYLRIVSQFLNFLQLIQKAYDVPDVEIQDAKKRIIQYLDTIKNQLPCAPDPEADTPLCLGRQFTLLNTLFMMTTRLESQEDCKATLDMGAYLTDLIQPDPKTAFYL